MKSPSPAAEVAIDAANSGEDDYLTMTFAEPSSSAPVRESLTQATKRKQREAEHRGRPKSKSAIAAEEAARRDEALARSTLDPSSKGFKMMAKLGYKPGSALGKRDSNGGESMGLLEPVGVELKEGRSGIGADSEKKRKFRQEVEAKMEGEKRQKVDEGEFRERQRLDREERRKEAQIAAAQKVAERLEEEEEEEKEKERIGQDADIAAEGRKGVNNFTPRTRRPLSQVNVLWRGAVKQRELAERDRRMRYDLHQSLSRNPMYDDPDEDKEDEMALGKNDTEVVELDLDLEDEELDEFESLESSEKLQRLVQYLRQCWHYCFWCKYRYEDDNMDGCPGTTEEDHD